MVSRDVGVLQSVTLVAAPEFIVHAVFVLLGMLQLIFFFHLERFGTFARWIALRITRKCEDSWGKACELRSEDCG